MVGSGFPYTEFLPRPGQARAVQVDVDASMLGLRYPMEVLLTGDAGETLRALLPLLERREDRGWRDQVEGWTAEWWRTVAEQARIPAPPLNPQLVVHELSARLPDRAIVTADSGTTAYWLGRTLRLREGMMASVSGTLATMGCAVPYAVAAKLAHPDRPVVALVGDGAMQMLGMNTLIAAAKYRGRWTDPRLVVIVFSNRDLNYVTWEQRAMDGFPKLETTQDVPELRYDRYAELLGLRGIRVASPDELGPALDQALAADGPVVIDAVVSADVPTLPPSLEPEQKKTLREALDAGDEDADDVREQLAAHGYEV
jgi:pyruvate dehydrogenase (quinone)